MEIQKIEISDLFAGGFLSNMEGVLHQKALPCFSVVQSVVGSYDITLDQSGPFSTGAMGAFAAPPGRQQKILHHNGKDGVMEAHWLFFNASVNGQYPLESLYRFPVLLPASCQAEIRQAISRARESDRLCIKYAAAYTLVDILLEVGVPSAQEEPSKLRLQAFVRAHYAQKLKAEQIASQLHCSVPQVYRYTQKYFQCSPANYVNRVRLENAARLLEITGKSVKEIAFACGFDDLSYFSRLFRGQYGLSPQQYRDMLFAGALPPEGTSHL